MPTSIHCCWKNAGRRDRTAVDSRQFGTAAGRNGVLLVEMVICAILLGTVSLILVPSLHAVARQRQAIRFDTLAMIEINNLHQLLTHNLSLAASPDQLELSAWFRERYSDAALQVTELSTKSTVPDDLRSWRLTITRTMGIGRPDANCSAVVWISAPVLMKTEDSP